MPLLPRQPRSRFVRLLLVSLAVFVVAHVLARLTGSTAIDWFARLAGGCFLLVAAAWLARAIWRRLFWSVGRRLAFSYVLVGVLPLALIALLGLVASYLLSGLLLGHLSRDAIRGLREELAAIAAARLEERSAADDSLAAAGGLRIARLPATDAKWKVPPRRRPTGPPGSRRRRRATTTSTAPSGGGRSWRCREGPPPSRRWRATRSAVRWSGSRATSPRSCASAPAAGSSSTAPTTRASCRSRASRSPARSLNLRGLWLQRPEEETAEFYRLSPPQDPGRPAWRDRPLVLWMERTDELRALPNGETVADGVSVVARRAARADSSVRVLSTSEQADSTAWLALAGVAVLLFEIWAGGGGGGGLHDLRPVARREPAVARHRRGGARRLLGAHPGAAPRPARRSPALVQRRWPRTSRSWSQTAAQKEVLDKELALARRSSRACCPTPIAASEGVEFATHFEPSAAIGGDYFDVLARPTTGGWRW